MFEPENQDAEDAETEAFAEWDLLEDDDDDDTPLYCDDCESLLIWDEDEMRRTCQYCGW